MAINSYKKRLKSPEILEPGSELVVTIIEGTTLNDPEIGAISVGHEYKYEVFKEETYSSGIALNKPVRLSGSDLYEPLTVCIVNGDWPGTGKNFMSASLSPGPYFTCKALDQTTAMDAALQYRYDSGTQKLRLTGLASASEITSLDDILGAGQYLVVIYRIPIANIDFVGV